MPPTTPAPTTPPISLPPSLPQPTLPIPVTPPPADDPPPPITPTRPLAPRAVAVTVDGADLVASAAPTGEPVRYRFTRNDGAVRETLLPTLRLTGAALVARPVHVSLVAVALDGTVSSAVTTVFTPRPPPAPRGWSVAARTCAVSFTTAPSATRVRVIVDGVVVVSVRTRSGSPGPLRIRPPVSRGRHQVSVVFSTASGARQTSTRTCTAR
jgi:hypothetical protein